MVFVALALGEGTRTWEQAKFDELVKGTPRGVAIRSSGGLELAPLFKALYTSPSTYIWSIASDSSGKIFAATGAPARVYQITPDGQWSVIFEPQELQVQALLADKSGVLFAATAPDGKVYKIEPHSAAATAPTRKETPRKNTTPDNRPQSESTWSSSIYFDPGTKYIWDLAQDSSGNLFVATGDHGEVFRVTPRGEHSLFFKSDEVHIRVLDVDPKGNLIAGSDGSGLVYRISPNGQGFVLYGAPKKEITALAIDAAGNIYAAGTGEKRAAPAGSFPAPTVSTAAPSPSAGSAISINAPSPTTSTVMGNFPAPGAGATGGSEIYRIAPDGSPTRIWTSHDDLVYALGFDQRGRLLAGTGNRGHIFAITGEDTFVDLLKASATQVTAFAKAPNGGLYVSTSNLGKVFLLGPGPETEGSYESDVFDAHIFSRWGRAEFRGNGNVELFTRSGNVDNPDRNWSPWTKVALRKDGEPAVPPARFIQWKAVLHAGNPLPRLDSVLLNYLPKNLAPTIDDVTVQVGTRYQPVPKSIGTDSGSAGNLSQSHFDAPTPSVHDRDSVGVKWSAHDDNDDQMVFSVYYRGDGESRWLLLKDNITDRFYSFDASLLPDGGYTLKVVASDAPSHSPSEALSTEKESARFEIDTTPPHVENLNAAVDGNQIHVTFAATDSYSPIKRAEYSVDAGDWQFVEPIGQLSDSRNESYDFKVSLPSSDIDPTSRVKSGKMAGADTEPARGAAGSSEHVIVVRVFDRYENMSSAKAVIRGK